MLSTKTALMGRWIGYKMAGATTRTIMRGVCTMEEIAASVPVSTPTPLIFTVSIRAPHVTVLPQSPYNRPAPTEISPT